MSQPQLVSQPRPSIVHQWAMSPGFADLCAQTLHCVGCLVQGHWASAPCFLPPQLAAVKNLPSFLRYLTAQLHQQVPGGQVLWYDSVLDNGQLKWQNELNEHNK